MTWNSGPIAAGYEGAFQVFTASQRLTVTCDGYGPSGYTGPATLVFDDVPPLPYVVQFISQAIP